MEPMLLLFITQMKKANDTVEKISHFGHNVSAYRCDVSNDSEAKETINKIINQYGRIAILVNNAGIRDDKLVFNMDYNCFNKVIQTNLIGTFNMIHHCYMNFIKNNGGRIINISSVVGLSGNVGQANYA